MEEKVVFKFEVFDERIKQEAMKVVMEFQGITSFKFVGKDSLKVKGEFDKFEMLKKIRKIDEDVEIIMFGPNGEVIEPEEEEVTEPSPHQRSDKRPIDDKKPADDAGSSSGYGLGAILNKENMNKAIEFGARVGGQINRENMNKAIDLGARVGGFLYKADEKKQENPKEKQKKPPQQEPKFLAKNKGWWPFGQGKKEEKMIFLDKNHWQNKRVRLPPLVQERKEEKKIIPDKNNGKNKEKANLVQKQVRLPPLGPNMKEEKKIIPDKNNVKNKEKNKESNGASSSTRPSEQTGSGSTRTENQTGYTDFWRTTQSTMSTFLGGETTRDQRSTQAPKTETEKRRNADPK